jgi:hypothetical protein
MIVTVTVWSVASSRCTVSVCWPGASPLVDALNRRRDLGSRRAADLCSPNVTGRGERVAASYAAPDRARHLERLVGHSHEDSAGGSVEGSSS